MVAEPFPRTRQSLLRQKAGINAERHGRYGNVENHCAVQYIGLSMNDPLAAGPSSAEDHFLSEETTMTIYEEATRTSKNALDGTLQSFAVVAKGLQQIASETSEFGKRSYEHQMTMLEQLLQARSVDKSLELQNDFAKSIYQSWVSQATKLSEIYADMAREAYKPLEQAALGTDGRGVEYTRETSQATVKAAKAAVDKPAAA